jgi:hypothetical protein
MFSRTSKNCWNRKTNMMLGKSNYVNSKHLQNRFLVEVNYQFSFFFAWDSRIGNHNSLLHWKPLEQRTWNSHLTHLTYILKTTRPSVSRSPSLATIKSVDNLHLQFGLQKTNEPSNLF